MDFNLNDSQISIGNRAKEFAENEVLPRLKEERPSRELISKLGSAGFFGCTFPYRYGGTEEGFLAHSVVCENISAIDLRLLPILNAQSVAVPYTIMEWGSEEAKEKYIKPSVGGEKIGCIALSEPNVGSDLASIETTIREEGNHYLIKGVKTLIAHGDIADYAVILATFDRSLKYKGTCVVIADTAQKGWQARKIDKIECRSWQIAEIILEDVVVPKENLLGEWGRGFQVIMTAVDRGRITTSSAALGLAQGCLNASIKHSNERVQFGQTIGKFQMVKAMIAEMVSYIEATRLLVRRASWLNDQNLPYSIEVDIAKYFAAETAVKCAGLAMEIYGGMAYYSEVPVERYYRDSKFLQDGDGTSNIMRILIADDALGYKKANRPRLKIPSQFMDIG